MLLRVFLLGAVMFSQSGCVLAGYAAYTSAKQQSQKMAAGVMAVERPDLPSDQAGECVVNGMSVPEIMTFGGGNDTTPAARHVTAAKAYAQRDVVAACLATLPKTKVKG